VLAYNIGEGNLTARKCWLNAENFHFEGDTSPSILFSKSIMELAIPLPPEGRSLLAKN
jgi:hypothetical protein